MLRALVPNFAYIPGDVPLDITLAALAFYSPQLPLSPFGSAVSLKADLLTWIGATLAEEEYDKARKACLEGTCNWLEDIPAYKSWLQDEVRSSNPEYLWICGPAGFGKSVLCAHTITKLKNHKVVYFFCKWSEPALRRPSAILRAWVYQIVRDDPEALRYAQEIHGGNTSQIATTDNLWRLLRSLLRKDSDYTLVVDGFDECIGAEVSDSHSGDESLRVRFLESLTETLAGTRCRVLLFSRELDEIEEFFRKARERSGGKGFAKYKISSRDTQHDTTLVSRNMVDRKLDNQDEALKEELSAALGERSDGMFLWIQLTGKQLNPGDSEHDLRETVKKAPPGLENVFARELETIRQEPNERLRSRAEHILRWITCAMQPLTVSQISEALIVDFNSEGGRFPIERLAKIDRYAINRLEGHCGSLVKVVEGALGAALGDHILQFDHSSVADYLAGRSKAQQAPGLMFGKADHFIDHDIMARICLRYLLYEDFNKQAANEVNLTKLLRERPFLTYAAQYWKSHMHECKQLSEEAEELCEQLFDSHHSRWVLWAAIYERSQVVASGSDTSACLPSPSPLYYASLFGFQFLVDALLSQKVEVNVSGGLYGNPLQAAAYGGHVGIVSTLLSRGAEIDTRSGTYTTSLIAAAAALSNQAVAAMAVLKALLEEKPELEVADSKGCTAFHYAVMNGLPAALSMLCEYSEEEYGRVVTAHILNIKDKAEATVLHHAANRRDYAMVRYLVEQGADTNAQNIDGFTPLMQVVQQNSLETVKFLLENGAATDLLTTSGKTILHVACRNEDVDLFRLLSDIGTEEKLIAPFREASPRHKEIVQLLIERGADIHARSKTKETVLHTASSEGHEELVRLFLDKGVDMSATDEDDETALHKAVLFGHLPVTEILITRGANAYATAKNGQTLLHAACMCDDESTDIVEVLLRHRFEVDKKMEGGETPLFWAAVNGHLGLVKLLLAKGADLHVKTDSGATILHQACISGHEHIVRYLFELGSAITETETQEETVWKQKAEINAADDRRWTALLIAIAYGHNSIVKLLIEEGADVTATTTSGTTILHALCEGERDNDDLLNLLLLHQSDVNVTDDKGCTALYRATASKFDKTAQLLIANGADPKVASQDGSTCLHLAADNGALSIARSLLEVGAIVDCADDDGETPLHWAAKAGSVEILKLLLSSSSSSNDFVDKESYGGRTALFHSVTRGHEIATHTLLNAKANPNIPVDNGIFPLHMAIFQGYDQVAFDLMRAGANIHAQTTGGLTPFLVACWKDRFKVAEHLTSSIDLNEKDYGGKSGLCYASEQGNLKVVEMLVTKGAELRSATEQGRGALHFAAKAGSIPCLEYLSSQGLSLSTESNSGLTPMHEAASHAQIDVVQWLADKSNVNAADEEGFQAIHLAANGGDVAVVRLLLDLGSNGKAETQRKLTPLHLAAKGDHLEIAEALIAAGADVNAQTSSQWTVLHYAALSKGTKVANLLLDLDAIAPRATETGSSPLLCAAEKGHVDLVKRLASAGCSISDKTKLGSSALHFAAGNAHEEVVDWLVANGANVNAPDEDGFTPLHLGSSGGSLNVIKRLLSSGADVHATTRYGRTAQVFATHYGHVEILGYLNSFGVALDAQTRTGPTLLQAAAKNKKYDVLEYLIETLHQDPNVMDYMKFTPLHEAVYQCHIASIKLLMRHGADATLRDCFGRSCLDWARSYEPMLDLLTMGHPEYQFTPKHESDAILRRSVNQLVAPAYESSLQYRTLGRCFLHLDAESDARTTFEQMILSKPGDPRLIQKEFCKMCDSDDEIIGPRFICRTCPDIDLCESCHQNYNRGAKLMACRGHNFLQVPGDTWRDRAMDVVNDEGESREQWLDRLRQDYRLESEAKAE